jgi:RHS repeat-associated protein
MNAYLRIIACISFLVGCVLSRADDSGDFEVLAVAGNSSLLSIKKGVSINDTGYAAFVGERIGRSGKVDNVFSIQTESKQIRPLVNSVFEHPSFGMNPTALENVPTQQFGEYVQINNANQVLAWRNLNAKVVNISWVVLPIFNPPMSAPMTYWETWPVNGGAGVPGSIGMPSRTVYLGWPARPIPFKTFWTNASQVSVWPVFSDIGLPTTPSLPAPFGTANYFLDPAWGAEYPSKWFQSDFAAVTRYGSMNNSGDVVFTVLRSGAANSEAVVSGGNVMGTPGFNVFPAMADSGRWVTRGNPSKILYLLNREMTSVTPVVGEGEGFSLGEMGHPHISDDGRFIAFYGNLTGTNAASAMGSNVGPGVFVYATDTKRVLRVAGHSPGIGAGRGGDISQFDSLSRPCVNNHGTVLFLGWNLRGEKTLFTSTMAEQNGRRFFGDSVTVVSVGDSIAGLPSGISDIAIHDSLNNSGPYGEILFWAKAGASDCLVKVPAQVCVSCLCDVGAVDCHVGSVRAKFGLGRPSPGQRGAYLQLSAESFSSTLSSPDALRFTGGSGLSTMSQTNPFSSRLAVRQVRGSDFVANIIPETKYKYRIEYRSKPGSRDAKTGLFESNGPILSTVEISNPDEDKATNRLRIIKNGTRQWLFEYVSSQQRWQLFSGVEGALKRETVEYSTNSTTEIAVRSVFSKEGTLVDREETQTDIFPWGRSLLLNKRGFSDRVRETKYSYYTNAASDGENYGKLRKIITSDGSWTFFKEYKGGLPVKTVKQFESNSYSESDTWPDPLNRSSENVINNELTTSQQYLKGKVTSRSWSRQVSGAETWAITAVTPDAITWNDPRNLVSKMFTYTADNAQGGKAGRLARAESFDGLITTSAYYFEEIPDPTATDPSSAVKIAVQRTVTASGAPDSNGLRVVDGFETTIITDAKGNLLESSKRDVKSGLVIESQRVLQRDYLGRSLKSVFLDGTTTSSSYDCCRMDQTIDREGQSINYSANETIVADLDGSGKAIAYVGSRVLQDGVPEYSINDAMGRSLARVSVGLDGSMVVSDFRTYDPLGHVLTRRDATGKVTRYSQIRNGNRKEFVTSYPDGSTAKEINHIDGSRYELIDVSGRRVRHFEDMVEDEGSWVSVETETVLDETGNPTTEWIRRYKDLAGRVYKLERPSASGTGVIQSRNYFNGKGQIVRSDDFHGKVTLFIYNEKGQQEVVCQDVDRSGTVDYAGRDRIQRLRNWYEMSPIRRTVIRKSTLEVWEKDGVDQPVVWRVTEDAVDGTRSWTTDHAVGTMTSRVIKPVERITVATMLQPDGTSVEEVSSSGLLREVRRYNRNGELVNKTTHKYDGLRRLTSIQEGGGNFIRWTHYPDGRIRTRVSGYLGADGAEVVQGARTNIYEYIMSPEEGRREVETLPDGRKINKQYYSSGSLKRVWGGDSVPAEYGYDRNGRKKSVTTWQKFDASQGVGLIGASTTTWEYNPHGAVSIQRFMGGSERRSEYSATGLLKVLTSANQTRTQFEFDPGTGDLLSIQYSDGSPGITNRYDRVGRLVRRDDGTGSRLFEYHFDQLKKESYVSGFLQGSVVDRSFDSLHRITELKANVVGRDLDVVKYSYNQNGLLDQVAVGSDVTSYSYYPQLGRLRGIEHSRGGVRKGGYLQSFGRDQLLAEAVIESQYGTIDRWKYQWNLAGRIIEISDEATTRWSYQYDGRGQLAATSRQFVDGNNIGGYGAQYQYDDAGNLLLVTKEAGKSSLSIGSMNQLERVSYPESVSIIGRVTNAAKVFINGQPVTPRNGYFHAALPVTNAWIKVTVDASLTVDGGKNISAREEGILSVPKGDNQVVYDKNGNLISDGAWQNSYNAQDRLVSKQSVQPDVNGESTRVVYDLDAEGRRLRTRISKGKPGAWKSVKSWRSLYDKTRLVAEVDDGDSNSIRQFVWGADIGGAFPNLGGIGALLQVRGAQSAFVLPDSGGNVRALVDATSGGVGARYEYDGFGNPVRTSGALAGINPFRFSSKYWEEITGDIHYEYRDLRPSLGRWLSRDPMGDLADVNLYRFVGNNPLGNVDQLGLWQEDFHRWTVVYLAKRKCWKGSNALTLGAGSQSPDELFSGTRPEYHGAVGILAATPKALLDPEIHFDDTINPIFPELLPRIIVGMVNSVLELFGNTGWENLRDNHFIGSGPERFTQPNDPVAKESVMRLVEQLDGWDPKDYRGMYRVMHDLGKQLHTYADTWSHAGFSAFPRQLGVNNIGDFIENQGLLKATGLRSNWDIGHTHEGAEVDHTSRHINSAVEAAEAIYNLLPCLAPGKRCPDFDQIRNELFEILGSGNEDSHRIRFLQRN